jgi:cell division protein FtsB
MALGKDILIIKKKFQKKKILKSLSKNFFFIVYVFMFMIFIFSEGALLDFYASSRKLSLQKKELKNLQEKNKTLTLELITFKDPSYQQKYLRNKLGFIKEHEQILVLREELPLSSSPETIQETP